VLGLYQEV